ncbi:MAG: PQQ-dependent sugar dehydrogenase [Phycisphaerales bacterium]|jgi:quinoprotein glucose dehydrogenase
MLAELIAVASLSLASAAAVPQDSAPQEFASGDPIPKLRFERMLPELALVRPIQVVQRAGDDASIFIVEQPGRILVADPSKRDTKEAEVFLDIRERVNDGGNEEGLLSIAFHPEFPKKRELYAYYTASKPRRSVLSRFTVSEDGSSADASSEEVLLTVAQPYSNHNGGAVVFGPDGFLYLSFGDGGAANDPHHYAQNLGSMLGKVIRIDVSRKGEGGEPYAVPADNPFVGKEGALPEIWAYGTRNIWRMSFDRKTGDLWAGDVGQNIWEEVSVIRKGGNYGWNAREGFHEFRGGKGDGPFEEPVVEYHHREGLSITGGHVYRGSAIPALDGVYIYGDLVSSNVWGIRMVDGKPTKPEIIAQKRGELITSIDAMNDGTLVISAFTGGQDRKNPGSLWTLIAAPR